MSSRTLSGSLFLIYDQARFAAGCHLDRGPIAPGDLHRSTVGVVPTGEIAVSPDRAPGAGGVGSGASGRRPGGVVGVRTRPGGRPRRRWRAFPLRDLRCRSRTGASAVRRLRQRPGRPPGPRPPSSSPEPAGRTDPVDTSGRWAVLLVGSTAHHPERITWSPRHPRTTVAADTRPAAGQGLEGAVRCPTRYPLEVNALVRDRHEVGVSSRAVADDAAQ